VPPGFESPDGLILFQQFQARMVKQLLERERHRERADFSGKAFFVKHHVATAHAFQAVQLGIAQHAQVDALNSSKTFAYPGGGTGRGNRSAF